MNDNCIAVVTERKRDGHLSNLVVYPNPIDFLSNHANGMDANDIHRMTLAVESKPEGVLGMFDLPTQPWSRLYYMLGTDSKQTQDALRLAIYTNSEHTNYMEK